MRLSISGRQEPQLVPARSIRPMSSTERAPLATASQILPLPIPKHEQTVSPSPPIFPDRSSTRSAAFNRGFANISASQAFDIVGESLETNR